MKASPCSCVAAYWRKPPLKLPKCFAPVGWMPEKMRAISGSSIATRLSRTVAVNGSPELMIVMAVGATADQTEHVLARLQEAGVDARVTRGRESTVIGAIGEREVLPILKPYKLVSREVSPDPTVIEVDGRRIGDGFFGLIAGPCTVEYREQT